MDADAVTDAQWWHLDGLRASWNSWWHPDLTRSPSGPEWLQLVWTGLFNTGIAAALTFFFWGYAPRADFDRVLTAFGQNFVISNCIGYTIHVLFRLGVTVLGVERVREFTWGQRVVFYAGVPIGSVFIGYALGLTILGVDVINVFTKRPQLVLSVLVLSLLMSAFWYRYLANKARMLEAEAARERERARSLTFEKQTIDAQLRALQAQIEPHFLFNTLANVASLIDAEPAKARTMLTRLIELLRGSLDASRATHGTLAQELALVRAYLDILAIRMDTRLTYEIDVPEHLVGRAFPPLLLQPLIENAIRHGLEPKVTGGRVRVSAKEGDDGWRIEVVDDGLGFHPTAASGVGLSNLRDRLRAHFGERARLVIEERSPGTSAALLLPST